VGSISDRATSALLLAKHKVVRDDRDDPRSAGGIYYLYVLYRMNRYWWDAQVLEQDFDDKLSQAWSTLGVMRYPVSFTLDQGKRRSYALYLILSIVTFGIWWIVWDYKIHTDPENLFKEFHSVEDTVLQTVRAH
jgi:uncharacterized protein DUF4234